MLQGTKTGTPSQADTGAPILRSTRGCSERERERERARARERESERERERSRHTCTRQVCTPCAEATDAEARERRDDPPLRLVDADGGGTGRSRSLRREQTWRLGPHSPLMHSLCACRRKGHQSWWKLMGSSCVFQSERVAAQAKHTHASSWSCVGAYDQPVCMDVCMYACMHACLCVCVCVCMCVCVCVFHFEWLC